MTGHQIADMKTWKLGNIFDETECSRNPSEPPPSASETRKRPWPIGHAVGKAVPSQGGAPVLQSIELIDSLKHTRECSAVPFSKCKSIGKPGAQAHSHCVTVIIRVHLVRNKRYVNEGCTLLMADKMLWIRYIQSHIGILIIKNSITVPWNSNKYYHLHLFCDS